MIPDHGFASAGHAKFIRISDGLPGLPCFFVFFILANLDTYTAPAKGIHTLPFRRPHISRISPLLTQLTHIIIDGVIVYLGYRSFFPRFMCLVCRVSQPSD